eukprot:GABV01006672.1.p2 GENE.GABV01006672.1~~GABV01006672.1.p2  ORF type:complete len:118 (+),score=44.68 GABV01006672.1:48-401(+)
MTTQTPSNAQTLLKEAQKLFASKQFAPAAEKFSDALESAVQATPDENSTELVDYYFEYALALLRLVEQSGSLFAGALDRAHQPDDDENGEDEHEQEQDNADDENAPMEDAPEGDETV